MNLKPAKTFKEQIIRISEHGFSITDEPALETFLKHANYYRFSAYFLPFNHLIKKPDISVPIGLYTFDKVLRMWLYKIIGDIEHYSKTQIAYYLAHEIGAEAHLDEDIFNPKHDHTEFLVKYEKTINENRRTLVVKHHKLNYGGKFPIWVVIEFFSIGMLSLFYSDLKLNHQKHIANNCFGTGYKQMSSWFRVLTELRNKCAHYSRFYYWRFTSTPKNDKSKDWITDQTLFSQIYCLSKLYPREATWNYSLDQLNETFDEFDDTISLHHIGFPSNWKEILKK